MRLILLLVLLALSWPVSAQTRFLRTLNTIQDMVGPSNNPLQIHTNIFVADTNRGGIFYWQPGSTLATNLGTRFASQFPGAASGRYIREYSGLPNVRWFGATPDDVTADTAAFQNALSLGEGLYVPDGTYIVDNLAFTNIVNGLTIEGQSWNALIKREAPAGRIAVLYGCNGFTFRNLSFDNNGADTFAGITSYDSSNILLDNVRMFDSLAPVTGTGVDRFAFVSSTLNPSTHFPSTNIVVRNSVFEDLEVVYTHVKGFQVTGNSFHRPMITCAFGWAPSNNNCVFEDGIISGNFFYDANDQGAGGRTRTAFYIGVESTGLSGHSIRNIDFHNNQFIVSTNSYQDGLIRIGNFSSLVTANCSFNDIFIRDNTLLIQSTATSSSANGLIFFVGAGDNWKFTNVVVSGNISTFNNKLTDTAFDFRNLVNSKILNNTVNGVTNAFGTGGTTGMENTIFAWNNAISVSGIAYNINSSGLGSNYICPNYVFGPPPASRFTTVLQPSDYLCVEPWQLPKLVIETGGTLTLSNLPPSTVPYINTIQQVTGIATNLSYIAASSRFGVGVAAPARTVETKSPAGSPNFLRLNTSETNTTNALAGIELLENDVGRWTIFNSANGGDQLEFRNENGIPLLAIGQTDVPADLEVLTWIAANNRAEWQPGAGGGATNAYNLVEDEGVPLTQRTTINFVGAGVTSADSGGKTVVTIPGGGGTTINTTDTVFPYRLNGTTFADSPLARVTAWNVTDSYRAADNIGPNLVLLKQGRTGNATDPPAINAELGVFGFGGWNGSVDIWNRSFTAVATENWSPTGYGHDLQFWNVPNGSTTGVLRLTIGQDGTSTFGGTVTTPLIDANASDVETYSQHGITNIVAGAADFTALGPSVVVWTNSSNTTIDIIDLQTAANRGQPFTFTTKGNGTATVAFTCATHTIDWRGPQITTPGTNEWVDYDFYRAGALLFGYANANGFETGLGITNINGVVSNNIVAGSNISITAGGSGQLTIASTGGGSGSVTNVSSGNITNLFTVGIANPTTDPAFTFTRVDPGAHRITMFDNTDDQFVQAVIGSGLSYDPATDTLSSTSTGGTNALFAYQSIGTGTDFSYSIATDTYEKVVFGTTGPSFVITNAGSYQVILNVSAYDAGSFYQTFYITNVTDGVEVAGTAHSVLASSSPVDNVLTIPFQVTTTGANRTFELWGKTANATYTSAGVNATNTVLNVIAITGTAAGGSGDFVGPASSVDNTVVLFDGTTGKLGKQSTSAIGFGNSSAASLVVTANLSGATDPTVTYANNLVTVSSPLTSGTFTSTSSVQAAPGSSILWAGRSRMLSPADNSIQMMNNASTDFDDLIWGPATTSFPLLRATNAMFSAMLADGSAFTDIQVAGEVYGASWDNSNEVPTKNDVYDKIQTISGGGGSAPTNTVVSLSTPSTSGGIGYASDTIGTNLTFSSGVIIGSNTNLQVNGEITTYQVTATNKIAFPNGSASAPGLVLSSDADTGIYGSAGLIRIVANGSNAAGFSASTATLYGGLEFSDSNTQLNRESNAILQMGPDAASPVAQTLKGPDGSGTDIAGGRFTIAGGRRTGTGAGGDVVLQTTPSATSTSSSAGTLTDRFRVVGKGKVLTDGAAVSLFEVALPTLKMAGGRIVATITCTDGTDMQSFSQTIDFAAVNKGAAYTSSITASTGDKAVSAGTLTSAWTILTGTDKITIQLNADTSLTPSSNSFTVYYQIFNNSEQAITIL